jgi:tetrahydromethanopterin S-methyltransferase subunit F
MSRRPEQSLAVAAAGSRLRADVQSSPNASSLSALVGDLAGESADLVRHETRLARLELGALMASAAGAAIGVAIGGVLMLLGALSVLTGAIILIGHQWLVGRYWLAGGIAFVAAGVVGGVATIRGMQLLSVDRLVAPDAARP